MTQADNHTDAPPRRRRWPRLLLALLVVLAVVAGLFYRSIRRDERELARLVAEIRARGEPMSLADLRPAPIPDEDNAAVWFIRAGELYRKQEEERERLADPNSGKPATVMQLHYRNAMFSRSVRRKHAGTIQGILSESSEVFSLCDRARRCKGVDWRIDYDSANPYLPVNKARWVSTLLELRAQVAGDEGDSLASLTTLDEMLCLSDAITSFRDVPSFMMGQGGKFIALWESETIVPRLDLPRGSEARQVARELIRRLLPDPPLREAMVASRCSAYVMAERVRAGEAPLQPFRLSTPSGPTGALTALRDLHMGMIHPSLYVSDELELLRLYGRCIEVARSPSYPQMVAGMPRDLDADRRSGEGLFLDAFWPWDSQIGDLHFRTATFCRFAATALAIRLYQCDHGGRRPAMLAELVPEYLPAVPVDPYAADGRAIGYLPDAAKPVVYSVYKDGKDDGGSYAVIRGSVELSKSADLVYFLNGDRPMGSRVENDE